MITKTVRGCHTPFVRRKACMAEYKYELAISICATTFDFRYMKWITCAINQNRQCTERPDILLKSALHAQKTQTS